MTSAEAVVAMRDAWMPVLGVVVSVATSWGAARAERTGLRRDVDRATALPEAVARLEGKLDGLGDRLARIERQLDRE